MNNRINKTEFIMTTFGLVCGTMRVLEIWRNSLGKKKSKAKEESLSKKVGFFFLFPYMCYDNRSYKVIRKTEND